MRSELLEFGHKDLLYDRLKSINTPIAEYSFANLYLFRDSHKYKVIFDKEIFVRGMSYDGFRYLMPTVDVTALDPDYLKELLRDVDFLFPIPERWMPAFDKHDFDFVSRTGDMDYIYAVDKMSTYKGRRLHKKRNLLKQFAGSYSHKSLPLTEDRKDQALFILDEWRSGSPEPAGETDYYPCRAALKMSEELALCGVIYYAEDEPAGFVLGEELNSETFVLHFAKARTKFKGIYQFMFNSFAKILPVRYRYLNFEQDLEKEALRIAKSSYVPDMMLRKVRVSLK